MKRTILRYSCGPRCCLLWGGASARADVMPIFDFTGGNFAGSSAITIGFRFQVTSPITITGLGIFDEGSNGLSESHQVGLWDDSGSTLLGDLTLDNSANVVASTSGLGRWLEKDLASALVLNPGFYRLGAFYPANSPDDLIANATSTAISGVALSGNALAGLGGGFAFPNVSLRFHQRIRTDGV